MLRSVAPGSGGGSVCIIDKWDSDGECVWEDLSCYQWSALRKTLQAVGYTEPKGRKRCHFGEKESGGGRRMGGISSWLMPRVTGDPAGKAEK